MRLPLKILIGSTVGVSLVASLTPAVQNFLALSRSGIAHFYLWQLLTYPFVESYPFSLIYIITVAFNMYFLWLLGDFLLEEMSVKRFFILYFGSTLAGAAAALAVSSTQLAGTAGPIYAIIVAWIIRNPDAKLLFLFAFPIRASKLIGVWLAGSLGITLFLGLHANAASLIGCVIFGYLFAIIHWQRFSHIHFLHPLERRILRLEAKKPASPKIYDIHSCDPVLKDDEFMDAMLDKISKQGKESLTDAERARMDQIARKRQ